jgi:hypothetical protein
MWYNISVKRGTPQEKPFEDCAETKRAMAKTETVPRRASGVLVV